MATPRRNSKRPLTALLDIHDVEKQVKEMETSHLLCRDLGHAWTGYTAKRVGRAYEATLRCTRCKSTKTRLISPRGEINGSKFSYTDGYLIKGFGRATVSVRSVMRLDAVMRIAK